jgi:capsule biosynthesis phosphatase
MKLAIDIDGTICSFRQEGQTYAEVEPLPGAVEKLRQLKENGHYIILLTARHMKTCQGNVGLVVARQGKTLLDWLGRHEIPYDEIWFGKPQADIYIDDNGYRFQSWKDIAADGSNLPVNREKAEAARSHTLPST